MRRCGCERQAADQVGENDDRRRSGEAKPPLVERHHQSNAEHRARERERQRGEIVDRGRQQVALLHQQVADGSAHNQAERSRDASVNQRVDDGSGALISTRSRWQSSTPPAHHRAARPCEGAGDDGRERKKRDHHDERRRERQQHRRKPGQPLRDGPSSERHLVSSPADDEALEEEHCSDEGNRDMARVDCMTDRRRPPIRRSGRS